MTGAKFISSVFGRAGIFLGLLLMLVLSNGCNQGRADVGEIVTEEEAPVVPKDTLSLLRSAVCIWSPYASLRREPGRKLYTKDKKENWMVSIRYGEVVELMDSTVTVESEKRDYMKVRLTDGKEGWVYEYLFEKYAKPAVILKKTELYRRPNLMTLRDDFLSPGEIIVLIQDPKHASENKSWYHVSSKRKIKKGWIHQPNHISTSSRDVKAALLFHKADDTKSTDMKLDRLNSILKVPGFEKSQLYGMVEQKIKEVENEDIQNELFKAGTKLFIIEDDTWMRSNPETSHNNQIKPLSKDEVCLILDIGERDSLEAMYDFWYRIQHGDAEGWVYGHYTSMRYLD